MYVRTGDLLKQYPDMAPWRPKTGLQPRLTDAELVTLGPCKLGWLHLRFALGPIMPALGRATCSATCLASPGITGGCAPLVGILHGCLKPGTCYGEHTAWGHHHPQPKPAAA